jgi:two-component system phosphate regulon response regulator OmpR
MPSTRPAALAAGREQLRQSGSYDALLLDLMLPDADGLDLCRELRQQYPALPLIVLSARASETQRVLGLELGADDYLAKPFSMLELVARVRALLRRAERLAAPAAAELRFGPFVLDTLRRSLQRDGQALPLTLREFDLLVVLAQSAGRVLTRDQIMDALKGHPMEAFDRSIDVHVSRIRACIEDDPKCTQARAHRARLGLRVRPRKQDD